MPTITSQPSTSVLHAAYGTTLEYFVEQAYTSILPAMQAEITINGSLFSTQHYEPISSTVSDATFQINIAGIVQEYFKHGYSWPGTITGHINTALPGALAAISVKFIPWLADGAGLLVEDASSATSNTSRAINASQTSIAPTYAGSNRQFLTNKPDLTIVKTNELEWLALYLTVAAEVEIKTYNSAGLQGTYRKTLAGAATTRIVAMGIGIPNLLAMQGTGWTFESSSGGDILDGGSSKYYTVQVKTSGGVTAISELRTYYIDASSDCLAYRIYWLNVLGEYDQVSLYHSTYDTFGTESSTAEATITEAQNVPLFRLRSTLTHGFLADFKQLTDEWQEWLLELVNTVMAYEGSVANPVVVNDMRGVLKDTYAAMNELPITFTYSNKTHSQRN